MSSVSKYASKSGEFAAHIRDWSDGVIKRSDEVVKKTIFDIFSRIVARTPVDLGYLINNWQIGINNRPSLKIGTPDKSGGMALASGAQAVGTSKGFGDTYYITNNLPYAIPIEYGHSRVKAPAGMVRVTLVEFRDVFYGNYTTV